MEKYDVNEIVKWILSKEKINYNRLERYLYFLYGEYLVIKNDDVNNIDIELFKNNFEGWAYGAVNTLVYNEYSNSTYKIMDLNPNTTINISMEDDDILTGIYNKYKNYSTDELEEMMHRQKPWLNSRIGIGFFDIGTNKITTKDIFESFKYGINNRF